MYTSHTHTERERQGVSNSLKIVKYALMFSLGIKFVQWSPLVRSTDVRSLWMLWTKC